MVVAVPFGMSITLLAVATVHQWLRPGTLEKIKQDIRNRFELEQMGRVSPPEEKCCQEPEDLPARGEVRPFSPLEERRCEEPQEPKEEVEPDDVCPVPTLKLAPVMPGTMNDGSDSDDEHTKFPPGTLDDA